MLYMLSKYPKYSVIISLLHIIREMVVFKEGDPIYHSKLLTFYRKEPFNLEAHYEHPDLIPYPQPLIGEFKNIAT